MGERSALNGGSSCAGGRCPPAPDDRLLLAGVLARRRPRTAPLSTADIEDDDLAG